jgi:hypothetical protein
LGLYILLASPNPHPLSDRRVGGGASVSERHAHARALRALFYLITTLHRGASQASQRAAIEYVGAPRGVWVWGNICF